MERYLAIHAHFYQPPRENPWIEAVETQDGAYPYHDWNERIMAECYGANAFSRILSETGRIKWIINNYLKISFDFGPTLLIWLKENAPGIHDAIVEADKRSVEEHGGHGNALAQAYNHMIMPLATRRDKETQVIWGVEDFKHRFGRQPEGMWLPETAVDLETLDVLAEAGLRFTVLAPGQAHRVRRIGDPEWSHVDEGSLDIKRPYRVNLPSGRSISVFFYNGPVSRAVAFEALLRNGETFANRLLEIFSKDDKKPQFAHIATDGESYGHHSRFADMALAYCIHFIESRKLARITNYGEFLEKFPPEREAEIKEFTSWSCFHGVERWRSDCGCSSGAHLAWNQKWRAPLRESLDWLGGELAKTFEKMGGAYFTDPRRARNRYIEVVLDRSARNVERFLEEHAPGRLAPSQRVDALKLLEMQRQAMLMFTSCGWFFDDISGIEAVQVLQYAGRAIQLREELYGDSLEEGFLSILSKAESNVSEQGNGRDIYLRHVRPVDLRNVAVHYAISSLYEQYGKKEGLYCYDIGQREYERFEAGQTELAVGRVDIRSRITWEHDTLSFAVLKMGNHDLNCGLCPCREKEEFEALQSEMKETFQRGAFSESLRVMDKYLKGGLYSLKDLFTDEQRKIISIAMNGTFREFERVYLELYERNRFFMKLLKDFGIPLPKAFLATAEFSLNSELRKAAEAEFLNIAKAESLYGELKHWGLKLDQVEMEFILRKKFGLWFKEFSDKPSVESMSRLVELLKFSSRLPFSINLWEAQNIYYTMAKSRYRDMPGRGEPGAGKWAEEFRKLGEALHFSVEEVLRA